MKDREPWERFMGSGRIDDYLHYAGDGEEAKIVQQNSQKSVLQKW